MTMPPRLSGEPPSTLTRMAGALGRGVVAAAGTAARLPAPAAELSPADVEERSPMSDEVGTFLLLGASGDLAGRLLLPALGQLLRP